MKKRTLQFGLPVIENMYYQEEQIEQPSKEVKKAVKRKVKEMRQEKAENEPWDYRDYGSIEDAIQSLDVFNTWKKEDGEKFTKKEIRESLENFDEWLRVVAEKYKDEYRQKENGMFD